jgi:secreted PhoX family phosphatase
MVAQLLYLLSLLERISGPIMTQSTSRRSFLKVAGAVSAGFAGLRLATSGKNQVAAEGFASLRYGPLKKDPQGVIDLPEGFSYRVMSKAGERMDDGLFVPGMHDGMAAFPGPDGKTILVRNHECGLSPARDGAFGWNLELLRGFDRSKFYDRAFGGMPPLGGTTTLVYDTSTKKLERHFLSLAGTLRNCAGGPTPWGTWISCEETEDRANRNLEHDHGYNFEVPASSEIGLTQPVPLRAMGRFRHEAVAVDPFSGIVYETEDREDGLIYRFIPEQPGHLVEGGKLQALAIRGQSGADTRNWLAEGPDAAVTGLILPGTVFDVAWIDLDEVDAPNSDLRFRGHRSGAARFARGEGMWYGNDSIYFACTNGGQKKLGQIWRYVPSPFEGTDQEDRQPGRLELFIESNDVSLIEMCDNLTVAPWGDVILSEDGQPDQYIVGVTSSGRIYQLARNSINGSEFAGVVMSPDGSTLFANIQNPGVTLAIDGPWRQS